METYIEQGDNRKECELKIAEKYKRPFHILSEKEIRFGGFLGLFPKTGVQVEFYFAPNYNRGPATYGYQTPVSWNVTDIGETKQKQPDLEEVKRKVLAAAGKDYDRIAANGRETSQQILDSLKEIRDKIEGTAKNDEHQSFVRAKELLKNNDFSENYINEILEKLRKEITFETVNNFDVVQDRLLELIGESIGIYKEETPFRKPKIMVLIGPTGVGKTTTISKLAAIYGIGTEEKTAIEVRLITIDAYRICAKEQLMATGNIMQIPVTCVVDKQGLRKEIAIHSEDTDMFLVDTIGKSPKDASKLGEMKEILDGAGRSAEFHLVISAGTKTSDIEDIMRQFEPFNYKSIVLTKMDETDRIGNIISALAGKKKSVSYITDGQTVPVDIRRASVVRFLINLDGFKVNREKIEKHFPSKEADQFKWR
jgi:flagellar biosynthesis protein FlhF